MTDPHSHPVTPTHPRGAAPPLWRHLLVWVLLALALVWTTLTLVAYSTGRHEAAEITDGQLTSAARLLLGVPLPAGGATGSPAATPARLPRGVQDGYAPALRAVLWDGGRAVVDTHGLAAQLPLALPDGLQWVELGEGAAAQRWRVLLLTASDAPRRVAVLMAPQRDSQLGWDIAEHIVRPALVLVPLVAVLLAWAVRQGLGPLNALARDIDALDVTQGQPLRGERRFRELVGTVAAINALVERLREQIERERRFASDVAHEMRTPLTAITLQARLAREAGEGPARAQALAHVERQALQAGEVLAQLLDLARAEGLRGPLTQPIELGALLRELVAELAPLAHDRDHDIALEAPDAPVTVHGDPVTLRLAVRNLLDNAIRHTPAGTQVLAQLQASAGAGVSLSVSDDGARAGAAPPEARASAGLGIGLTLVRRIAAWQGIAFSSGPAPAPMTTRYALHWPA